MRALPLIAAVALATPAAAQGTARPSTLPAPLRPAAMTRAFKAICIDHSGDRNAQAVAATSPPWGFVREGEGKAAEGKYKGLTGAVTIGQSKTFFACSLSFMVDGGDASLSAVTATARKELKLGAPSAHASVNEWQIGSNHMFLEITPREQATVAVYTLFIPKGSAAG